MQFGTAPLRMQEDIMRANPKFGPVYMNKNDMSDGFYRIRLTSSGSLKLAVVLPANLLPGQPQLVALPLVLPMGWTESPPWFCAFTETVADLTNEDLRRNKRFAPHPLAEQAAITDFQVVDSHPPRPVPKSHEPLLYQRPLRKVEIFVDDFIGMGQDDPQNPLANQRNALSHNIDKVFRPNRPSDSPYRKEPQSQTKMAKGDASWHTRKEALGWYWGATSKTLQMKPKRVEKALLLLTEVLQCKRVSVKRWQQLLGVLRSLQTGMVGSEGQFSLLQDALVKQVGSRVRVTAAIKEQLKIFCDFLTFNADRPTTLEELVPGRDLHVGACDAAKAGRGGVWFTDDGQAILWRAPYLPEVQKEVVSDKNPTGKLTNSDLELEGTILHHWLLGKLVPLAGETTYTGCDNTPAVAWRTKGSSTTNKARARLLRLAAGMRRHHRAHHRLGHLSGVDNRMADDASRLWHLSDDDLLTYFSFTYPQSASWQLYRIPPEVNCWLTSIMLDETSKVESVLPELQRQTLSGPSGRLSAPTSASTLVSLKSTIPSSSSCSLDGVTALEKLPLVRNRLRLEQRKMPCVRWARPFPFWG
mmetsp:Transcript_1284/g.2567  ORF Transcript_1284/g.2567 Transcript_1284/m.2567 type:complete len:585 (+) Transcript_1284:829-2583(+)